MFFPSAFPDDADTSTEKPSSDLDTSDQKTEETKDQEDPEAPSEPVTQPTGSVGVMEQGWWGDRV